MSRPPRALTLWALAGVVALATAWLVASDLATLHRHATSLGRLRPVVLAVHDLPLGHTVTTRDLRVEQRHASQVPTDSVSSLHDALGRVVASPALRGTTVVERQLSPRDRTGLDGVLPSGRRAMRVPDDAGLHPAPGSTVDVVATFDPSVVEGKAAPTGVVASHALVLDSSGEGRDATVLLMVHSDETQRLAFSLASGSVALVLAPPD
jgi:Flp pilus assembly protein CpaB